MRWKNENCNNDRPACKKEHEGKFRTKIAGFRLQILDLITEMAQDIIQLTTKSPGSKFPLCFLLMLFSMPAVHAQDKYSLVINLVKDTNFPLSRPAQSIQPPHLQTSFKNITLCTDYIARLPGILSAKGYPAASIDSVYYDSLAAYVYVYLGPQINRIEINTDSVETKALERSGWIGNGVDDKKNDLGEWHTRNQRILDYYETSGYPFTQVKLDSLKIVDDLVKGRLVVNRGILYRIDSISVFGKVKIKKAFLQRYLGITNGSLYNAGKLEHVHKKLLELPYLREQYPFTVSMLGTGATLNLYLEPRRSSQVNFLVGFLPGDNVTGKSQLTGDINLNLKNSFGSGEDILLNWQQLQRRSPRLNLGYQHPYIFNSPFGIDLRFDLLKRDSAFLQLNTQVGLQFILTPDQAGRIFLQNQRTYLLQGGYDTNQIRVSKVLPPNIDVNANGIGIDYEWVNTNYRFNPIKGNELKIIAAAGLKKISKNNDIAGLKDAANPGFTFNSLYDSLQLNTYQVRLTLKAARYFELTRRSTFKTGLNVGIFQSRNIFRNELFQIGGYRLLRGFNDESIYVTRYALVTGEYRYLVGLNSYFFAFTDIGFTKEKFQVNNVNNTFIGTGIGLNLETRVGLLNISYAIGKRNDVKFDILNASKIHIGYMSYF